MLNQLPTPPEPEQETLETLRESLHEAQRKLAYYQRFGPMLEEQMSTVVAKAAEVAAESEQNKADMERELGRLRQEAESLRAECEWRRAEASAIIAEAHHDAAGILARARGDVSTIVSSALSQLEQAQKEVLHSSMAPGLAADLSSAHEPLDSTPPAASHTPWTPIVEQEDRAAEEPASDPRVDDQEASVERIVEIMAEPVPGVEATDESADDDAVVTYLTIHSHMTQEALPQFGRTLESLPGVRGTAVARVSDDAVELVVAHHRDTDLLARMRSIPGLDFRLVTRGEGLVEIEILERNAPPLRA
jgi:hypothetical protein